jgi:hypothetical protein
MMSFNITKSHGAATSLLFMTAFGAAGCQTVATLLGPPPHSAAVQDGLNALQQDSAALFRGLSAQPPACLPAANASQFATVAADLANLTGAAGGVPGNARTTAGLADLTTGFSEFERAATADGAKCPPRQAVADYQLSFGQSVQRLAQYEQMKP